MVKMYSTRWNLVHLLGGKCRDCNNENFYELEVHHRYNDGDGERKYYIRSDQKYLNQPQRAIERLEVLCKQCHENAHHPKIIYEIPKTISKTRIFIDTIKTLEGEFKKPIREDTIILTLLGKDFSHDEVKKYIKRMLSDATIYESRIMHYNTV